MLNKRVITNLTLTVVILVAVGLSGFGFYTFQRSLESMSRASQEEISWSTTQLEIELMRFRDSLHITDTSEVISTREVNNRFDILWSRVVVFQRGKVGERLREYDQQDTVNRLFDELKRQEVSVVSLSPYDFAAMAQIRRAFFPYSEDIRHLSQRVFTGEEAIAAQIRKQMRSSATFTLVLSVASVVFMLIALVYYGWQGQRFKALAYKNQMLAKAAEKASLAKSQFLTMMSHELRTPMNGVLGLLALVRQTPVSPTQDRLLEQADHSANQMINMLTDILDFSALEGADAVLDPKPFAPRELARSLTELLAPDAQRAGIEFAAVCLPECPTGLNGDFVRLRQSFSHLVRYFTDTAGIGRINLEFTCEGNNLLGRIQLEYAPDGESWTPDLILGGRSEGKDSFAVDALGPAVARGLIRNMGGDISLSAPVDGMVQVNVRIPVEMATLPDLRVKCEVRSLMMQTLCRSALTDTSVTFVEDKAGGQVNVVLMEAGNADEAAQIGKFRQAFSDVYVIGIGVPGNAALFDSVIDVPFQVDEFRKMVFHRTAS